MPPFPFVSSPLWSRRHAPPAPHPECLHQLAGHLLHHHHGDARSYADEVAWVAALLLFTSTLSAYLSIRNHGARPWQARVADAAFLGGVTVLALSVVIAAIWL
jgi:hypothetical protein